MEAKKKNERTIIDLNADCNPLVNCFFFHFAVVIAAAVLRWVSVVHEHFEKPMRWTTIITCSGKSFSITVFCFFFFYFFYGLGMARVPEINCKIHCVKMEGGPKGLMRHPGLQIIMLFEIQFQSANFGLL